MPQRSFNIALVGNPNTGKSTLFNLLTGLDQKVSNFPGVTVDKKKGNFVSIDGKTCTLIDLPGTYSLYPKSEDEFITSKTLLDKDDPDYPHLIVFVAEATNLKRNLLLYSQVADLGIPILLVINMMDELPLSKTDILIDELAKQLGVQVVGISAKKDRRLLLLKQALSYCNYVATQKTIYQLNEQERSLIELLPFPKLTPYAKLLLVHHEHKLHFIDTLTHEAITQKIETLKFDIAAAKAQETIARYCKIQQILAQTVIPLKFTDPEPNPKNRFDAIATHPIAGFALFLIALYIMFQSVFSWSAYPSEWIENFFTYTSTWATNTLPEHPLSHLLIEGVWAGLSGVLVFIPQIAFLFTFIAILEDSGYMARVIFMMDKLMKKVGLNGRSVIPLIGGFACAVPAIMSARSIGNKKERLITILVTPLVSCSARLPIFILLIAITIPNSTLLIFNVQTLVLMSLYGISLLSAFLVAFILNKIIKAETKSFLVMELPAYRIPVWHNVAQSVYSKVKTFALDAGKVIILISIVLWGLSSYAPSGKFDTIEQKYTLAVQMKQLYPTQAQQLIQSEKLENSYAGIIGKSIEPLIQPLGFDWKIGIALITSFAAREVFVGTMATLYSVQGDADNLSSIRKKISTATNAHGVKTFSLASSWSLLIFYLYAMQCMSTLAITLRETGHWKWAVIQFIYMGAMAYLLSWIAYTALV